MLGPRRLPAPSWLCNRGSRLFRFNQLSRDSAQEWPPGGLRTMSHDPKAHRWLLEWSDDLGDPDHDIRATADTVEEARAAIDRILTGVTWTPEAAREFGGGETPSAWNHFSQGPSRPVAGARKAMAQSSTASAAARRVS